ncbi:hypothetical protein V6N13_012334 [Hibiscus sabdariffa]|uniref:Uncharacterized protein n=1 Tax=Hibiscus sabdariffa TaxID=183260 RepID=A0ABR2SET5_9ROSI
MLEFIRAILASFHRSIWSQSYIDSIVSFFTDFLKYVFEADDPSPDFDLEIAGLVGEVVTAAVNSHDTNNDDPAISRAFLLALSQNFLQFLPSNTDNLINFLFGQLAMSVPKSRGS